MAPRPGNGRADGRGRRSVRRWALALAGPVLLAVGFVGGPLIDAGEAAAATSPTITSISPDFGPAAGGNTVTVAGAGFAATTTAVTFGGQPGTGVQVSSSTSLTVVVPSGTVPATTATATVTAAVTVGGHTSAGFAFTYYPKPTITSITPGSGPLTGGGSVTIRGTSFTATPTVSFGGTLASTVVFVSGTKVTAKVPTATALGPVAVTVAARGGPSTGFTYTYDQAPAITSAATATFTTGKAGTFTVAASGYPASTVTETGTLPAGVTLAATGKLSGTPTASAGGAYPITFKATNGATPAATQSFTLTVDQAPAITSAATATFTVGTAGSFQVTATGYPTPTFTKTGTLPSGVTLASTGKLSGTPKAATGGTYPITLKATNGITPAATQSFTLTVDQAPAVTSTATAAFVIGTAGSFQVTATGYPTPTFTKTGTLPSGVTLASTGKLSGTPKAATGGTYKITVKASNGVGTDATQKFTLTVDGIPTITSISPDAAPVAGKTVVTIVGTGFTKTTTTVTFGGVPGTKVTVFTTTLTVTVPAHASGTVEVTVTALGGTSAPLTFNYDPVPTVTSITPAAGSTAGGTAVTITGTGFTATTTVKFGNWFSTVTAQGTTTLTVTIPTQTKAGSVTVKVATPGGTATASFTYDHPPLITGFTPTHGPISGGNTVTVTGHYFTATTTVMFGGVPGTAVHIDSSTKLTVVVPAGTTSGTVTVTVTTPGGTSFPVSTVTYTYVGQPVIDTITHDAGPVAGGNTVTVTGSGFVAPVEVTFGGIPGSTVVVNSLSTLTVVVPPGTAGTTVTVTVTTGNGTSTASSYNYSPLPAIYAISPNVTPVAGGTVVAIVATNLTATWFTVATDTVTFGGTSVPFTYSTATGGTLTVTAPGHAAGAVTVTVTTPNGTSTGYGYAYVGQPTITSINPDGAPISGGTVVNIVGTEFTRTTTTVTFGGVPGTTVMVFTTTLTVTVPAGALGTVTVVVTSVGGTSTPFTFSYDPVPTITSISPDAGSTAGGTIVTVTGTGFTPTTTLTFGERFATRTLVTFHSSTTLTVVIPTQTTPGTVPVTASTPGGTSTGFTFTYDAPPTITGFTPTYGPTSGGNTITITGTRFTPTTTVLFGTGPGSPGTTVQVNTTHTLTVVVPARTTPGTVTVTVTTPGGKAFPLLTNYTYVGQPVISSVTASAGDAVTVLGSGFTTTATVTFNGQPALAVTYIGATQLFVTMPTTVVSATPVTVVVTTPGGTSTGFDYYPPPTVAGLTPAQGPLSGANTITISGSHFTATTTVMFGANPAPTVTVNSSTTLIVVVPEATTPGTTPVTVTTPGGTTTPVNYIYRPVPVISSVTASAGDAVTVLGSGFTTTATVTFNGQPALAVTYIGATQLFVTMPTTVVSATPVTVVVTTPGGTSTGFDYYPPPTVAGLTPAQGPLSGANTITISGSHFTATTTVMFGANPAPTVTVNSSTTLIVVVPEATTPGTTPVTVTTPGGTTTPVNYIYRPVPVVTSVSPDTGPVAGDNYVTVLGSGFTTTTTVTFNGTAALSVGYYGPTDLSVQVPPGSVAGTVVTVTVTTPGGTSIPVTYAYNPAPTITSVTPDFGPLTGDDTVRITGSELTATAVVTFGGVRATTITANTTTLTAVVPAGTKPGPVTVIVTTPNGASNVVTYTYGTAPTVTSRSSTTFTTGAAGTFQVTTAGFPTPTVTETGTLPEGVTLSSTGQLSGTPAATTGGIYTFTLMASNEISPGATQSFTLTVNQAPVITSTNQTTFVTGTAGTFQAVATGYPAATFSETGALPQGVTFSSGGLLSGTPATGTVGNYALTVKATNGVAPAAVQSFTLTVSTPPFTVTVNGSATVATVKKGTAASLATAGIAATATGTVTFASGSAVLCTANLPATGCTTPATLGAGSYPGIAARFTPTDGHHEPATSTNTVTLAVVQVTVTSPGNQQGPTKTSVRLPVTASVDPAGPLTYTATNLPTGLAITTGSGVISGTPTVATRRYVTVTATTGGVSASVGFTWTVATPLSGTPVPTQNSWIHSPVSLDLATHFHDTSGNPLTYSATNLPPGLSIGSANGVVTGTTGTTTTRRYVTMSATDGTWTASVSFLWYVTEPLSVTTPSTQESWVDTTISPLQTAAADAITGAMVTYGATNLPTGLSIGAHTGQITGTTGSATTRSYVTVTVTSTSAAGTFTTSVGFIWLVTNPLTPPATPTPQGSFVGTAVTPVAVAFSAIGIVTYSATNLPTGLAITIGSGVISGTPTVATRRYVTVTAHLAGSSYAQSVSFLWTVSSPLTLAAPANQQNWIHSAVTPLAVPAGKVQPGVSVTYSATNLPPGLSLTAGSGTITGITPATTTRRFVTVMATAAGGATASASFVWTVTNPMGSTAPASQYATVGTLVTRLHLATHFTDAISGASISYSVTNLPPGLAITPGSGVISGTPTAATRRYVTAVATSTSAAGTFTASTSFNWFVTP